MAEKEIYPVGVIHGRFQILHKDHMKYLLAGKALCRHLVVGITNPDPSLTRMEDVDESRSSDVANPLNYYERYRLIKAALEETGADDYSIVPLPINLPELYRYYVPMDAVFFLTIYDDWGRRKKKYFEDLGLRVHVLWEVAPDNKGVSGTDVRRVMAEGGLWQELVPPATVSLLTSWGIPDRLRRIYGRVPD